jgi:LysM repeat protein
MRRSTLQFALAAGLALAALLAIVQLGFAQGQTHIVQPGENLFRIALRYGVTVQAIQAANGLNNYIIYVGQTLIIPDGSVAPAPAASPVSSGASTTTYIVQPGETLFLIGLKFGITWDRLQAANGLASDSIYAGQSLIIPLDKAPSATDTPAPEPTAKATPAPPTETPTPETTATPEATDTPAPPPIDTPTETATPVPTQAVPAAGTTHIVQSGESLFSIGVKYGLLWTTILQANSLPSETIYPGQQLFIPASDTGYQPPAVVAPPPPPGTGRRFLVVLSQQRLYAYDNDQMVRTTLISSGIPQYPTVTGTFYIYLRYVSARMIGPGYDLPNVPYVMYFYQSYGLHGTYWHNNFGHPMSHGCINMPTSEAEWAFNWSTFGTPVIVRY